MKFCSRLLGPLLIALAGSLSLAHAAPGFSFEDWKTVVADTEDVDELARLYLDLLLETDPSTGLQVGIHGTPEDPAYFDDRLKDVSPEALEETHAALMVLGLRLQSIDPDELTREAAGGSAHSSEPGSAADA